MRRCATLAAWGSAWLAGQVSYDEVLDAMGRGSRDRAGWGFDPNDPHPVATALTDFRRAGSEYLVLALPVPGDVRGLAGPPPLRTAALAAGEAVFGMGYGVTLAVGPPVATSAGPEVLWYRSEVSERPSDPVSMAEAEHDLAETIRETASVFARRGAANWLTDIAPALSDARRSGERLNLPASHPQRGVRLVAQAERLAAVLAVVDSDDSGELTSRAAQERHEALAPLRIAVRRALIAGYNSPAEVAAG